MATGKFAKILENLQHSAWYVLESQSHALNNIDLLV
jgi:hypothetical protein